MFNEEMAVATADAYARSNNQDKCQFPGYFEGLWDSNLTLPDIKIKERVMSEFASILRQLILNLLVALSYQEKDVDEWLCKEIIDKIKEDCDKLNQLNKSFCCFNKKLYQKYVELVKIIYKLYIPILSSSDDSYYDMLKEKITAITRAWAIRPS